jgi:hypothetical protein
MTTPDATPGENPALDSNNVAPVSEQPQTSDPNDLSADQLLEMITGDAQATPNPAPDSPAPSAQDEDEPPAEPTAASKPPGRVSQRFLPAEQQMENAEALALIREGKATDMLDALQSIRGLRGQPAADPATAEADPFATPDAPEPQDPTAPASAALAQLEATLADLREQREQAEADYEEPRVKARIQSQIEDTIRQIAKADIAAERQSLQANSYNAEYQSAVDVLEAQFPESLDEDSQFYQLLDDKVTAARARNDAALQDPKFILKFAEEIQTLLAPKTPGRPASAPPRAARPTGAAVAPGHSQAPRPTQDQIKAAIDNADPDDLLAALSQ